MNQYKKINNISGWLVFIIATLTYWLTVEMTASYWDCGEFIAVSYKLEVPHPPGAPLFLLIGRMFSFLALGDVEQVAYWINISSVIASGFTILFMFWSITLLGKKLFNIEDGKETKAETIMLMGGALIGSLAYTWSDSFWFSAVEAEVYAMSSFFTAFVVWAMLKWDNIDDERLANRWIILLAYMMGLSIGVHLLNLVTIPALGLLYYFKKYNFSTKGLVVALAISGFIVILINNIIIPGLPSLAGWFEINFVNSLGLPFGVGVVFVTILVIGSLVYGIYYSQIKEKPLLNTALLSLAFILIGYSSYSLVLIRSGYNPPIDENNPENIISFVSYLKREQYGSRPLLKGQYFDARLVDQKFSKVYRKGKDKYEVAELKPTYIYDPARSTILPRAYSSDPRHIELYREYMGLGDNEVPNFSDNLSFMFKYQLGRMYFRYFMWNFAGRESDVQGAHWQMPWDAFENAPEAIASNKGRNNFFLLPLILGLIGLFFQFNKDVKGFAFVAMLFFLTGVALVLYLNSPPVEPRERDYIYVGSYYAFAIWIGFGAMAVTRFLGTFIKNRVSAGVISTIICMSVPVIMVAEGWDDHDRSDRYFSVDSAKNFLASCAPNAILFTGGDNDTFPLWYAQEVEGFRTDVRVIVLSYFNTDWYIDQMTRNAYESEPLPFSLKEEHYRQGGPNDYIQYRENPNVKGIINLQQYLQLIRNNHAALQLRTKYATYNTIPSKQLFLDVDTAAVKRMGIVPKDKEAFMTDKMVFTMKRGGLEKNTLMILDLIANNNWERPIYFNHTSLQGAGITFNNYVMQEGNAYRLLPVQNPNPRVEFTNTEVMYENVMNKFFFRELDNPDVYYTEDYRNFVLNHRSSLNNLAAALISEGKTDKAKNVIYKSLEAMPDISIPYDYTCSQMVDMLMRIEDKEKAKEIADVVVKRADEVLTYFATYKKSWGNENQKHLLILSEMVRIMRRFKEEELAAQYEEVFARHYAIMN